MLFPLQTKVIFTYFIMPFSLFLKSVKLTINFFLIRDHKRFFYVQYIPNEKCNTIQDPVIHNFICSNEVDKVHKNFLKHS